MWGTRCASREPCRQGAARARVGGRGRGRDRARLGRRLLPRAQRAAGAGRPQPRRPRRRRSRSVPRFGAFLRVPAEHLRARRRRRRSSPATSSSSARDGKIYLPQGFVSPKPRLAGVRAGARGGGGQVDGSFFYDTRARRARTPAVYTMPLAPTSCRRSRSRSSRSSPSVDNELARIRLWLVLVADRRASGSPRGAGLPGRAGDAAAAPRAERDGRARPRDARPVRADRGRRDATSSRRSPTPSTRCSARSTRRSSASGSSSRTPRTSCARRSRACARTSRCSRTAIACRPRSARSCSRDVVAQLGEMTELIGELTELARGEEQAEPLEDVRLDLVTEEAIRRATRNHPEVPIEADLAPTSDGRPAGEPRARDREPARQRRQVEPRRLARSRCGSPTAS